jgi:1-deoxy-D-xylulose-5-phosphate reductoisomerase
MDEPVKGVAVLGSTGSVGTQALDVLSGLGDRFQVKALAAGRNLSLLTSQIEAFRPKFIAYDATSDQSAAACLVRDYGCTVAPLTDIVSDREIDIVVLATSGIVGLPAALAALESGKILALANKEILVIAGGLLRKAAERGGGELRPVDSEHSAIWQCLWGERGRPIRVILTASGGALRDCPLEELHAVTPTQALRHPTWQMGPKITIDSATLLNKGLETIEARWLFDVPLEQIDVVLHRESIVHSLVELADGSVKAQLGYPDMRLPIQCALTYPERMPIPTSRPLNLAEVGRLSFTTIDVDRFPCLGLAMEAGRRGGTYPAVLVAADEVAVDRFLAGDIGFMEIPQLIGAALAEHQGISDPTLEQVFDAGLWARSWAEEHAWSLSGAGI